MPTTSLTIDCSSGHALAAKLDEPEGDALGYAVFAHCFTCSKDSIAAARIGRALAFRGIGVLRIDFTGLGDSGGEFGESTFSGNLGDLRAACAWLRENRGPPGLLIGHSLGGAAVLALGGSDAQGEPRDPLAGVRAVATIGAPADPQHVTALFGSQLDTIRREGSAEVSIGGRPFRVEAGLVDDLSAQDPKANIENLSRLGRALMIFHSPVDTIVGIDNAATIYGWARHPKSFVSLDKADHLLTKKADAELVAGVLAAWAGHAVQG
ncbi:MAG: alpha/beta hydrolase [Phycisphaera sp.]|nr:MAG: alpha/beta hydrolase [Phycisphaera sp.]